MQEKELQVIESKAQTTLLGAVLFIVGFHWFIPCFFYPMLSWEVVVRFWEIYYLNGVTLFLTFLVILCSYLVAKQRLYFIVVFTGLFCVYAFCSPFFFEQNLDNVDQANIFDLAVKSADVMDLAKYCADYSDDFLRTRHYPKLENTIWMILLTLTPPFFIGLWAMSILLRPRVIRSFYTPLKNRLRRKYTAEEANVYYGAMSKNYAVLMLLLLISVLPMAILLIFEADRQFWMVPPPNRLLNVLIILGF